MGLVDDFKDLPRVWKELNPLGKTITIVGVVLSALSVASIADATFQLKGFIVNAIYVYRQITEPVVIFLSDAFDYRFRQAQLDLIVLGGLSGASFFRASRLVPITARILGAIMFLLIFVSLGFAFDVQESPFWLTAFLLTPLAFWLGGRPMKQLSESPEIKRTAMYILIIYLLVGFVAGVSEGVSRPIGD